MATISVACVADEAYAPGLAVTIRSLFETLRSKPTIDLWILDGGFEAETKQKLLDSWKGFSFEVHWLTPDYSSIKNLKIQGSVNYLAYGRLLLPNLIPVKKLLYLDSDTLVCSDISELWATNLGNNAFGATQDLGCMTVSDPKNGLRNFKELGIRPDHPYCNSGVLLMDLDCWRKENIGERVIDYVATHKDIVRWCDQDGLNAIAGSRWLSLNPEWNSLIDSSGTLNWSIEGMNEETLKPFRTNPKIVHFIGPNKPWKKDCFHPYAAEFQEVLNRTAF